MTQLPTGSAFSIQVNRELFVFGNDEDQNVISKAFEPLSFIRVRNAQYINQGSNDLSFVVALCDYTNGKTLASVAKFLTTLENPNVHKILMVSSPQDITSTELLFAAEIGAHYVAAGIEKEVDLRRYVKRIALQAEQLGSITHFENEVSRLVRKGDAKGLAALDARLAELSKDSEEVLKLRALVNYKLGKFNRFESFLKQTLQINPQNLWAASELGKHFLRMRKPREGIALLEKLSRFHDLNTERYLCLGNAYLNVGDHKRAEATFEKGLALDPDDGRLEEGLAKVKIMQGDTASALDLLHDTTFSEGVISFLNMRAIMFIKSREFEDGYALYHRAIKHSPDNDVVKAKLHYNLGLGYIRNNHPDKAALEFEKSIELGGKNFRRAAAPLEITRKLVNCNAPLPQDLTELPTDFRLEEFEDDTLTDLGMHHNQAS